MSVIKNLASVGFAWECEHILIECSNDDHMEKKIRTFQNALSGKLRNFFEYLIFCNGYPNAGFYVVDIFYASSKQVEARKIIQEFKDDLFREDV